MKKILSLILVISAMLSCCLALTSCDSGTSAGTYYVATSDFFYSSDKGKTYGNGKKEFNVDDTIYMQLIVKITSNKEVPEPITIKLTIPEAVDLGAAYFDGQPVTPEYEGGNLIYGFTVPTNGPSDSGRFVFQFRPTDSFDDRSATMTLKFDDKIDPAYDKQNTIFFYKESSGTGTTPGGTGTTPGGSGTTPGGSDTASGGTETVDDTSGASGN